MEVAQHMKKNQPDVQPGADQPRLTDLTRLTPTHRVFRKFSRAMPAAAVVLVLSTLILFTNLAQEDGATAAPDRSPDVSSGQSLASGSSFETEDLIDDDLLYREGSIDYYIEQIMDQLPTPTATPEPTPYPVVYDADGVLQEGMPPENFTADNILYYVLVSKANVRSLPNTSADIVARVTMGDALTRTGYGLNWSQVQTADGQTGYILTSLITAEFVAKPTPTPSPTPKPTAKPTPKPTASPTAAPANNPTTAPVNPGSVLTDQQKADIVALAKSCLGVRYVYASEDMSGFDCSGLTLYIYKQLFGITLPRSARGQASAGKAVSYSNIDIGDIICLDCDHNDGIVDHVGIYIGDGQMIDASATAGKVRQKTLRTDDIVTIRRIIY